MYKLKFKVSFRAPENLLIFGKSGDSGRLNNNGVVGHRDPLVERELAPFSKLKLAYTSFAYSLASI